MFNDDVLIKLFAWYWNKRDAEFYVEDQVVSETPSLSYKTLLSVICILLVPLHLTKSHFGIEIVKPCEITHLTKSSLFPPASRLRTYTMHQVGICQLTLLLAIYSTVE